MRGADIAGVVLLAVTALGAAAGAESRGSRIALARADTSASAAALATARMLVNPVAITSYTKSTPQYHAEVELPLDFLWLRGPRVRAAGYALGSARPRFQFERAFAAFDADTAYTPAQAAAHARLSSRNAQDADSLLHMATVRRDAGDASDLDVQLAAVSAGPARNACVTPLIGCAFFPIPPLARQPALQPGPGLPAVRATAGDTLTLAEALREAHAANAQLAVAALGVDIARTAVREGRASRSPRLGLESGLNLGGPLAYTTSQGALQLVATDTLFAGGLRRANLRAAQYRVAGAGAGFRVSEKDVDLAVRLRFADFLRAEAEIRFRQQGIDRLRSYLTQIQQRRAAGQPIGGDLLTTQVRLGSEEALLADARRMLVEARLQLNDLMGRVPDSPLSLVALPAPGPPPAAEPGLWVSAPEVRQAEANSGAAQAGIAATRSERRPQLGVSATAGALPVFGRDLGTGPNAGSGLGGAVFLSLSMPLLDGGVYRARFDRAQLEAQQAKDSRVAVEHQVRLSYQLAAAQLTSLYTQVEAWTRNVPLARDAYLQTESIYNGGAATALEVLDAYTSWINANQSYADAVLRYRQADANYLRWGTP